MDCPKYKNYTRECLTGNREFENYATFDYCRSEKYVECPMYKIIIDKEQHCEFTEKCKTNSELINIDFEKTKQLVATYCFSKKHGNCARYKLLKAGKEVPDGLLADGSMATIKV